MILLFGSVLAVLTVQMLVLAQSLYVGSKDSAKVYADIETYKTATELICYQFVSDLNEVTVEKDLATDWVNVAKNAVYTQALDSLLSQVCTEEGNTVWNQHSVLDTINSSNLSDESVLNSLVSKISGARGSFTLSCPEPIKFKVDDEENSQSSSGCHIGLKPILIQITLQVKAETIVEQFEVDGIYLDMTIRKDGQSKHKVATFRFGKSLDGEKGVVIYSV